MMTGKRTSKFKESDLLELHCPPQILCGGGWRKNSAFIEGLQKFEILKEMQLLSPPLLYRI
jgi:hypothetical protein